MVLTLHCQIMKTRFLFHIFFVLLFAVQPSNAHGQQCDDVQSSIIKLKEPVFRDPILWETEYGDKEGFQEIVDVAIAHKKEEDENETFVILGDYTKDKSAPNTQPFLARMDKRGDIEWDKRGKSNVIINTVQLLKTPSGYAVLGNISDIKNGKGFYIAVYNKEGKRTTFFRKFTKGAEIEATGFALTKDKKGYIIIGKRVKAAKKGSVQESIMYQVSAEGVEEWHKRYNPGVKTLFRGVKQLPNNKYAVVGEIEQPDGTMAGWLLKMDRYGGMEWQKQYPRGSGASIYKVKPLKNGSLMIIGNVAPIGGDKTSAWVMKVSKNGHMLWQRHFIGNYKYTVKDLLLTEDDRIFILLDVRPLQSKKEETASSARGHVSILTLSSRGYLLNVENFTSASHGHPNSLLFGENRTRIIGGYTISKKPKEVEGGEEKPNDYDLALYDGWLFSASSLQQYVDPCGSPD